MSSPWGRVERLDAGRVAAQPAEQTGVRLIVEGPCSGGEVGAAFVRWPDDRRSVLKWRPDMRLDAVLDNVRRPFWAHLRLRVVDWAIRHFTSTDVDHWLDLTQTRT
jgi:hypothetical protein